MTRAELINALKHPYTAQIGRRRVVAESLKEGAKYTAVGVVLMTLASCASGDTLPSSDVAPDPSALEAGTKIETNPVARAASVLLESTQSSLISSTTQAGHGGIFAVDGGLVLTTAKHVAVDVSGYGETSVSTNVEIPSDGTSINFTGNLNWTPDAGTDVNYSTVHDGAVSTQLTPDTMGADAYNALVAAVNAGTITPLIPTPFSQLRVGETVVSIMPDTGEVVSFTYKGHGDNGNYLLLEILPSPSGRVCEGFSGMPLLRAQVDEANNVTGYTNESFGTLVAFGPDKASGAQCETPGNNTYHDYVGYSCFPQN